MNILGISAFYHDSAACSGSRRRDLAAAQEERFTRKKHDSRFPKHAIDVLPRAGGIGRRSSTTSPSTTSRSQSSIACSRRISAYAPAGFASFRMAMPVWLQEKLHLPRQMRRGPRRRVQRPIRLHRSSRIHAASAFFPSPFRRSRHPHLDGVGEWATATYRHRPGQTHRADARAALSAFARPAVFGVHLLTAASE